MVESMRLLTGLEIIRKLTGGINSFLTHTATEPGTSSTTSRASAKTPKLDQDPSPSKF